MKNLPLVKILVRSAAILLSLFIVWIVYLANTNTPSIFFDFVSTIPYGDKLGHIGLFGAMTFFAIVATQCKTNRLFGFPIYLGTSLVAAFVVIEEASQYFFPFRTLDIVDLVANFLGVGIASLLVYAMNKRENTN